MSCLDNWETRIIRLEDGDTASVERVVSDKDGELVTVAWVGNLVDGYNRRELVLRPNDCLAVVGSYAWMMQREDMDG